jgi:hypothetical protein
MGKRGGRLGRGASIRHRLPALRLTAKWAENAGSGKRVLAEYPEMIIDAQSLQNHAEFDGWNSLKHARHALPFER